MPTGTLLLILPTELFAIFAITATATTSAAVRDGRRLFRVRDPRTAAANTTHLGGIKCVVPADNVIAVLRVILEPVAIDLYFCLPMVGKVEARRTLLIVVVTRGRYAGGRRRGWRRWESRPVFLSSTARAAHLVRIKVGFFPADDFIAVGRISFQPFATYFCFRFPMVENVQSGDTTIWIFAVGVGARIVCNRHVLLEPREEGEQKSC